MKYVIILFTIALISCETTEGPGTFESYGEEFYWNSCDDLTERVEEWNKKHPGDPKVADC